MEQGTFLLFLGAMSIIALFVFIALYFVKAGYGMFRTASWGISINNKLAWMLMEAPVFIVMLLLWWNSARYNSIAPLIFFLLFQLHYFQRAFVFPFLLKGKSRMPLIYPDENHWVLKPQNGVLWQRTFFEWLDKWLKPAK